MFVCFFSAQNGMPWHSGKLSHRNLFLLNVMQRQFCSQSRIQITKPADRDFPPIVADNISLLSFSTMNYYAPHLQTYLKKYFEIRIHPTIQGQQLLINQQVFPDNTTIWTFQRDAQYPIRSAKKPNYFDPYKFFETKWKRIS